MAREAPHIIVIPTTPLEDALLRNTARLHRVCLRLTGDPADADDLFQETWVRALTRPPEDLDRDLGAWLDRVARNLFIDRYRRDRRLVSFDEALEAAPELVAPALIRREASRAWVVALAALGPLQRAVFLLREVLEHDTAETAGLLGISAGAVRSNLHRARKAMAEAREEPLTVPREVLAELSSARVCSVSDVAMLGQKSNAWRRLWVGPADGAVWGTLLELLAFCTDRADIGGSAHLKYLEGALASRQGQHQMARDSLLQAERHAHTVRDTRLLWVIRHELAVVGLRAFDPTLVGEALGALRSSPIRTASHRVWMLGAEANLAFRSGDAQRAAELGRQVLDRERSSLWRRKTLANMALFENQEGQLGRALERVDAVITELSDGDDLEALASAWNTRGMILHNLGDFAGAETAFHTSVDHVERAFGRGSVYQALGNLALLRIEQGRLEEAWALLVEAQDCNQDQNRRSTAINLSNRAIVAQATGRLALAEELLDAAVQIATEIQELRFLAHASALRAAVRGLQGQDPEPDLAVAARHGQPSQAVVMAALGAVARIRTDPAGARETLASVSGQQQRCTARLAIRMLAVALDTSHNRAPLHR